MVRAQAHLGVAVSPHLVRDGVALTISEEAPGSIELVTILRHHASARSTIAYRHQASTIAAARSALGLHEQARERARRRIRAADRTSGETDAVFARFV